MQRFEGKVVLVTGGASGMGAAQARACVAEGGQVAIGDLQDAKGEALAAELGENCVFTHLDVRDESSWVTALEGVQAAFGGPPTVLLHNAGIAEPVPLPEITLEQFMNVVDVNLVGTFLALRNVLPGMIAAGKGAIVVNSSVDGLASHATQASYCASKPGMIGLARVVALEHATAGIRANAIAPGAIDTPLVREEGSPSTDLDWWADQVPQRRMGQPEEVARAVLFLASDEASYINGTTLTIDGGVMAQVPLLFPDSPK